MLNPRPQECERVRGWISAQVDGELSEFEGVLVDAHVRGCAACASFKAATATFSRALRSAPRETLTRPIRLSSQRRGLLQPLRVPAVAALVVSAIALSGLFASLQSGIGGARSDEAARFANHDLRQIRLEQSRRALAQLRERRAHFEAAQLQTARRPGFVNP